MLFRSSKPELEIYADDVVCGHGSTSAEIDEDHLFYCKSRGIPEAEARALLTEAFVGEAIEKVENEAVREALLDVEEGADWLMVKPAMPYLDVIRAVREASRLPLSAYNVSGEYSAVKAAAANGWLDEARIVRENLLAIRRAGADQIITYHARDALKGGWL